MELIRLLVLVKNALFQLKNVFGKILKTLEAVGLKHETVQRRNLLWALTPTEITSNKWNGLVIGSFVKNRGAIDFINAYCFFL